MQSNIYISKSKNVTEATLRNFLTFLAMDGNIDLKNVYHHSLGTTYTSQKLDSARVVVLLLDKVDIIGKGAYTEIIRAHENGKEVFLASNNGHTFNFYSFTATVLCGNNWSNYALVKVIEDKTNSVLKSLNELGSSKEPIAEKLYTYTPEFVGKGSKLITNMDSSKNVLVDLLPGFSPAYKIGPLGMTKGNDLDVDIHRFKTQYLLPSEAYPPNYLLILLH